MAVLLAVTLSLNSTEAFAFNLPHIRTAGQPAFLAEAIPAPAGQFPVAGSFTAKTSARQSHWSSAQAKTLLNLRDVLHDVQDMASFASDSLLALARKLEVLPDDHGRSRVFKRQGDQLRSWRNISAQFIVEVDTSRIAHAGPEILGRLVDGAGQIRRRFEEEVAFSETLWVDHHKFIIAATSELTWRLMKKRLHIAKMLVTGTPIVLRQISFVEWIGHYTADFERQFSLSTSIPYGKEQLRMTFDESPMYLLLFAMARKARNEGARHLAIDLIPLPQDPATVRLLFGNDGNGIGTNEVAAIRRGDGIPLLRQAAKGLHASIDVASRPQPPHARELVTFYSVTLPVNIHGKSLVMPQAAPQERNFGPGAANFDDPNLFPTVTFEGEWPEAHRRRSQEIFNRLRAAAAIATPQWREAAVTLRRVEFHEMDDQLPLARIYRNGDHVAIAINPVFDGFNDADLAVTFSHEIAEAFIDRDWHSLVGDEMHLNWALELEADREGLNLCALAGYRIQKIPKWDLVWDQVPRLDSIHPPSRMRLDFLRDQILRMQQADSKSLPGSDDGLSFAAWLRWEFRIIRWQIRNAWAHSKLSHWWQSGRGMSDWQYLKEALQVITQTAPREEERSWRLRPYMMYLMGLDGVILKNIENGHPIAPGWIALGTLLAVTLGTSLSFGLSHRSTIEQIDGDYVFWRPSSPKRKAGAALLGLNLTVPFLVNILFQIIGLHLFPVHGLWTALAEAGLMVAGFAGMQSAYRMSVAWHQANNIDVAKARGWISGNINKASVHSNAIRNAPWLLRTVFDFYMHFVDRFVTVEGAENLPQKGSYIVAGNHAHKSAVDFFILGCVVTARTGRVPKILITGDPRGWRQSFERWLVVKCGIAILVPPRKGLATGSLTEFVANELRTHEDLVILIAPAGRADADPDRQLEEWRPGVAAIALRSGRPVIPVAIGGIPTAWTPESLLYKAFRASDSPGESPFQARLGFSRAVLPAGSAESLLAALNRAVKIGMQKLRINPIVEKSILSVDAAKFRIAA